MVDAPLHVCLLPHWPPKGFVLVVVAQHAVCVWVVKTLDDKTEARAFVQKAIEQQTRVNMVSSHCCI